MLADARVRKWYEDFAKAGEDGYTAAEIEKAKQSWVKIHEELEKQVKQLEEVTGRPFGETGSTSGVTGELKAAMTEGTGSQLVGLWNMTAMDVRGIRELMEQNKMPDFMQALNRQLDELASINRNTYNTSDNTRYLEDGLKNMEAELKEIRKNTKQNNSRG